MDSLEALLATPPKGVDAAERCARAVVAADARWRVLSLLAPAAAREDVAPVLAWALLVERAAANADLAEVLVREVAALEAGLPVSALAGALSGVLVRRDLDVRALREWLAPVTPGLGTERGFATREELVAAAQRRVDPIVRAFGELFDLSGERQRVRARALAVGMRLSSWVRNVGREWRAGRLVVPAEDLARVGSTAADVAEGRSSEAVRVVLAELAEEAERFLERGWPLTQEIPFLRGVALARVLDWHAAALHEVVEGRSDSALADGVPPPASARLTRWLLPLRRRPPLRESGTFAR